MPSGSVQNLSTLSLILQKRQRLLKGRDTVMGRDLIMIEQRGISHLFYLFTVFSESLPPEE